MGKKLYLFLFVTLLSMNVIGQVKVMLSGRVVQSGSLEPLVGAEVSIKTTVSTTGTVTKDNGDFSLLVEEGEYTIMISFLGYEPKELTVNTAQWVDDTLIELATSNVSLNEIIVSESPKNYRADIVGSNFRISPESIANNNPIGTEEILRYVPGVNIVGDMGLSNRPNISIRGSWGRRSEKILMMEDGSPSAPAPYIAPGAYYNPVSDRVKAIEVYKGADLLRYGPNNMYGAINYVTALPPQKPELRVKLVGGQRDYTTALLSYGGTWNNLGALVEGVYKKFDGFIANSSVEVVNLNAKIFAKLSDNQSLYFKVSGQFEDNLATLAAQTPITFELDATANPFDADRFTMRRYGLDIIHKWVVNPRVNLTSKVYASDFGRDWWRQVTTKVRASDVLGYVGEAIYDEWYSYLSGHDFGNEDYVMVGQMANGRESTANSKWAFTVSGVQETLLLNWGAPDEKHQLEVGLKFHQETYNDALIMADSTRWGRSGRPTVDLDYYLWSASGYVRNAFRFDKLGITPIIRFEYNDMYRQDLLAVAENPLIDRSETGREYNNYPVILPGLTLDYEIPTGQLFGSIYKGFIAPSKVFGFLVEQGGVITNPLAGQSINMHPEVSLNTEFGWRGNLFNDRLDGQVTYFNNTVYNFFLGGRNEVFQELGTINIQGVELGVGVELFRREEQRLRLYVNATLMKSNVLNGKVGDNDLFSEVIHNDATRQEFIGKVNNNREAYELYRRNDQGVEVLFSDATLTPQDFGRLTRGLVRLGNDAVKAEAPYTPKASFSTALNYDIHRLSLGVSGHYLGAQFTEFSNFIHESADGSIGRLSSFFTWDAFANYDLLTKGDVHFSLFANGKNLTNEIFRASRLNRATGGISPGGFRQVIIGINIHI